MHWLDRAARFALSRLPEHRRVFREGWGDPDTIEWFREVAATAPPIPDVSVDVTAAGSHEGLTAHDLRFESPLERLEGEAKIARVRMVSPTDDPERIVILMPAWNDEGWKTRTMLARVLAERGIASAMLEAPLYGERRNGDAPPIARVSDFGLMGRGVVLDAGALASHLHRAGHAVGVSGYSMGGNLAAFVAAFVPFPIAAAPLAAAFSPAAPFIDGVLHTSVAWDALGGHDDEVVERLRDYLLMASVLRFEPPDHVAAAVIVAGTRDGFIPTASVQALHRHWPGSTLEWVGAGHGSLYWRRKDRLADAIVTSFDRIDAMGVGREGPTPTPPRR